jgi:hypothetical protein
VSQIVFFFCARLWVASPTTTTTTTTTSAIRDRRKEKKKMLTRLTATFVATVRVRVCVLCCAGVFFFQKMLSRWAAKPAGTNRRSYSSVGTR